MAFSTKQLDKVNKNGDRLCDAFGCRKHTRLTRCYRGLFCVTHLEELGEIRSTIERHKSMTYKTAEDIRCEIVYREREQLFRKQMHAGHMRYINVLNT